MFGRIGGGGNKGNDKNSKGGDKGNSNNDKNSREIGMWGVGESKTVYSNNGEGNVFTNTGKPYYESYLSNTTSKGGEGGKGGQWGYSGSNSGQTKVNPQVAKQITDKISSSESAIQNEIGRLKGLNPIASEETLRSAAIQFLGIATVESQRELEAYKKEQETGLAVNVAQKITPYVLSLNSGEWSLGIHTASSEGRKSKDSTYGLSNQVIICLQHLKTHGGADKLKVLTFTECDLTENDMIYFGNTMLVYPLSLNYLDFSYNRIGDIGTISFINSFVTSPTGKYPMHHIINLNLSNNAIGDDGAAHIAAYLKHGYMPATTHVNLADNIITDKGALCFAESFNSSVNKLKVLHLEGNNLTPFGSNPKIIKLVQNVKQDIKILVSKVTNIKDGMEKQGTLFFGSKEEKQVIIKNILKQSQDNGVDVKNVTVSKDIFEAILNYGKLKIDFSLGWVKCTLVPDSVKSFAADQIIAKASPLVGQVKLAMDITTCYFESFDESASSKEGVQFMGDLGFITQAEFFGVNE